MLSVSHACACPVNPCSSSNGVRPSPPQSRTWKRRPWTVRKRSSGRRRFIAMASSVPGEERGQGWIDRLRSVGHGQPYHAAGIENRGGERGVRSAAPAGDPPEPLEQNGGIRYWTPTADQAWPTEVTCGL